MMGIWRESDGERKKRGPSRAPSGTLGVGLVPSTGQRRPALPRASPAVPSARCGLASGFGMGPGVPRTLWPLTGGRRPAHSSGRSARALGAAQRGADIHRGMGRGAFRREASRVRHGANARRDGMRVRARAISTARLSASPRLHLRPIDQVFYLGPYRKEN